MPAGIRNEIAAGVGEFVGTFMFFLAPFVAVQVATDTSYVVPATSTDTPTPVLVPQSPQNLTLLYISFAFGISLVVNAWIFFRVSGSMFNPAVGPPLRSKIPGRSNTLLSQVTLALLLNKSITPQRGAIAVVSQLLASIAASGLANGLTPGDLRFATRLGHGESLVQGLFLETFLTFQLVLTIFFLAVEKHRATPLAPIGIGLSLFIGHLAGVHFTGASMNPVRSFGPDAISGFTSYHWIYWLGPMMGAALAFLVYLLLRMVGYESANAGQDSIGAAAYLYATVDATSPRPGAQVLRSDADGRRGDGSRGVPMPIDDIPGQRPAAPVLGDSKAAATVHYGTFPDPSSSAATGKDPAV